MNESMDDLDVVYEKHKKANENLAILQGFFLNVVLAFAFKEVTS